MLRTALAQAVLLMLAVFITSVAASEDQAEPFPWPDGKRAALSLSFDDARVSQMDVGLDLLNAHDVQVTFYVIPRNVDKRLEAWRRAVASGHEIGNHTLNHPCSGNFTWSRHKALEDYTLEDMRRDIEQANQRLHEQLGVTPTTFAYPCGQTYVGRGVNTRSYVPLVTMMFAAGRGWMDSAPNDPAFCDFAQVTGIEMDGKDFEELRPMLEEAAKSRRWVVLGGHEIGQPGRQTTRVSMLEDLLEWAKGPANGIWLAPVGDVAEHVESQRARTEGQGE